MDVYGPFKVNGIIVIGGQTCGQTCSNHRLVGPRCPGDGLQWQLDLDCGPMGVKRSAYSAPIDLDACSDHASPYQNTLTSPAITMRRLVRATAPSSLRSHSTAEACTVIACLLI
eukprot:scaffold123274_cov18-Prasinocladus_malaysianus.AAC.2